MRGKKQNTSVVKSIATGVLAAILLAIISSGISTILCLHEKIDESAISIITPAIIFISILPATFFAGKLAGGKYGTVCAATMLSFLLLQIGTNIIFFDGIFRGFIKCLICLVAGTGLSCLLLMKGNSKQRKRR